MADMTLSDYMTLEKVGNRNRGVANTALGLGIGLGSAALVAAVAVGWGVNAASKARSRAAENLASANQLALQQAISNGQEANRALASLIGTERTSREAWQSAQQPTIGQYVDVQTNPALNAQLQDYVTAMATAQATATANNNGINSAIGGERFVRAQLYSAPQPCSCPGSCNG